jgi:hypothetical protein
LLFDGLKKWVAFWDLVVLSVFALRLFSWIFNIDNQPSSGSVQAADLRPPFLGILLGWHRESV